MECGGRAVAIGRNPESMPPGEPTMSPPGFQNLEARVPASAKGGKGSWRRTPSQQDNSTQHPLQAERHSPDVAVVILSLSAKTLGQGPTRLDIIADLMGADVAQTATSTKAGITICQKEVSERLASLQSRQNCSRLTGTHSSCHYHPEDGYQYDFRTSTVRQNNQRRRLIVARMASTDHFSSVLAREAIDVDKEERSDCG
ncbi:hypothetical protein N658DRAFT_555959 [Parathielavia hyrcaniae]|uniref:Uncharacterized protein n=1 Tax=Parathielavia hyrcaniae TaxID=113614 RepID=A0AAN6QDG9_9PEZI|nr:hypothetical protein N658DRAFT_555959 [Parathielavia hyrcaniae]